MESLSKVISMLYVTPCFPQSVKINILAKYCGKLRNVNVWCEWTLWKRSMNVNNIMNIYIYCRTAKRGCTEKETTMAVEGTWKGGINFHRDWIPYLESTGPENQKRLAGPELNVSQDSRVMAPQELMRDGEVNHTSIEPSWLTSVREIMPHITSQEDKAWGRRYWGRHTRGGREL